MSRKDEVREYRRAHVTPSRRHYRTSAATGGCPACAVKRSPHWPASASTMTAAMLRLEAGRDPLNRASWAAPQEFGGEDAAKVDHEP